MTTFGCHSCGFDPATYKGDWEHCPCATCKLGREYTHTFSTGLFESGKLDEIESDFKFDDVEHEFITLSGDKFEKSELRSLETLKSAITKQMYTTLSGIIVHMLHIAKTNPTMFEVLIKKLQFPYLSYAEIGDTMEPKCSKQNVLYHLKSAVAEFPELESAIITDTRYSGGHYALKTLADKKREAYMEGEIQANIYGQCPQVYKPMNIKDLNAILKLPFMARDEIFQFNAYSQDEEQLRKARNAAKRYGDKYKATDGTVDESNAAESADTEA